jgi:hypothetical protein
MADKGLFSNLAERLSLPVPATTVIPPGLGDEPPDLTELGYPLITSRSAGTGAGATSVTRVG